MDRWTQLQGQYLAYIRMYTKINGVAPAEADMQRYFRVTPPSVHRMVLALEERGLVERTPGKGRSLKVLVPDAGLPSLD
jgi:Mn-dependent DtxR family transcriptional regulator